MFTSWAKGQLTLTKRHQDPSALSLSLGLSFPAC